MDLPIEPLSALIAGVLIFLIPRLLNYIVATYLVIVGLLGLFGSPSWSAHPTAAQSQIEWQSVSFPTPWWVST